ncbi:hypothetical protein Golob_018199 [Gossypium lobatum]|uniref:Protein kinase domain-containing protein n=1 Tax=Gossypium lobatum TaxID=34289 RepID=A0A7J8M9Q8_9ROSI|nr:hypothetical protein [Gossypium lobatum]
MSTLSQGLSRHFSISKIKQATKDFDECNMVRIGVGRFGKVYEGVIDGGTKMAIKRSNPSLEQRVNEFQIEVEMLSKGHLYNHNKYYLSWKQRLGICIGVAKGLHYLHTGA